MDSLSCLLALGGAAIIIFGIWQSSSPKNKKVIKVKPTSVVVDTQHLKKPNWIWPIIIAILFAFWSVVFALFFLAIVWVMRLNPKTETTEIPFPSDQDRKRAKGTYTWLLLSPFLNVIVFAIAVFNLYSGSTTNERVIAALAPLLIHLPVLIRLDSKSPFVFRHTQQAILLLALRTSMATLALNISKYPEDGLWLFLIGNGSLWLFGSFWGRSQAHRGTGWWIKQKGEKILAENALPTNKPITDEELEELINSLNTKGKTARQKALTAFHKGTPETRKKAVLILSKLGEVEKF